MLQRLFSRSAVLTISLLAISSAATAQQQPLPGKYCEAETVINGDRLLYRTSFIKPENLKVGGQPVEVDLLKNGEPVAHAWTRFTDNFTFTGTTDSGTPLSFQVDPATEQFRVDHAERTLIGSCGVDISPAIPNG